MAISVPTIPTRVFGQPIPVAPDMNQVVAILTALVRYANAGSNALPGGTKYVRYRDSRLYGVGPTELTLDRLDPATLVPGTVAVVLNPADNPTQQTEPPARYVATLADSAVASAVAVPAYLGAPAGVVAYITWEQDRAATGAATLWQQVSLATAQALTARTIEPGLLYQVYFGATAAGERQLVYVRGLAGRFDKWGVLDVEGTRSQVEVDIAAGTFTALTSHDPEAVSKTTPDKQGMAGELSLPDATFTNAPAAYQQYSALASYVASLVLGATPWAAGKQKGGSLVLSDGQVWMPLRDMSNSTVAPTLAAPNAANYAFVGGPAVLAALALGYSTMVLLPGTGWGGFSTLNLGLESSAGTTLQMNRTRVTLTATNDRFPTLLLGNGSTIQIPDGKSLRLGASTAVTRLSVIYDRNATTGNILIVGNTDKSLATATTFEGGGNIDVAIVLDNNAIALRRQYVARVEGTGTVYLLDGGSLGSKATTVTVVTVGAGSPGGTTYTGSGNIDVSGTVISYKTATSSGTALVFTQDAEYAAISSGTFTVDTTGAKVGVVVRVRLAAGTSAPNLPSGFTKLGGSFDASKLNVFSFCVCADLTIDYYVTSL